MLKIVSNYYYKYKKQRTVKKRQILRYFSLLLFLIGILGGIYIFSPLLSWQIYFAPVFAAQDIAAPIPKTTIVNKSSLQSLLAATANSFNGVDYTNASNWFPNLKIEQSTARIPSYFLSIPKLGIVNAVVSTQDTDLASHLVNYPGTAIPPDNGNAVIFGHSTLPQLFNPKDYKTIFANAYKIGVGDEISAKVEDIAYKFKVYNIVVVDPTDTSMLAQQYDSSYITLITCTPPGTTWKRLIIRARLEKPL